VTNFPSCDFDPDRLLLRNEFIFAANVWEIPAVVDRIMRTIAEMDCAQGKEFEIEIALREALVNAVVHGCKSDSSKSVQCCVACDQERGVLLVVRDPGPGFDPHSLPDPLMGENLFASHGRGIYLINQLMDEVTFRHGGTEIHMRKR
jgi:serine/threonine-protein kinase RsbW